MSAAATPWIAETIAAGTWFKAVAGFCPGLSVRIPLGPQMVEAESWLKAAASPVMDARPSRPGGGLGVSRDAPFNVGTMPEGKRLSASCRRRGRREERTVRDTILLVAESGYKVGSDERGRDNVLGYHLVSSGS